MNFIILHKGQTSKGSNYYKLLVEISDGIWDGAIYYGSTRPKQVTSLRVYKDSWVAEIQPHTSRDQKTGRFKSKRKQCCL